MSKDRDGQIEEAKALIDKWLPDTYEPLEGSRLMSDTRSPYGIGGNPNFDEPLGDGRLVRAALRERNL